MNYSEVVNKFMKEVEPPKTASEAKKRMDLFKKYLEEFWDERPNEYFVRSLVDALAKHIKEQGE